MSTHTPNPQLGTEPNISKSGDAYHLSTIPVLEANESNYIKDSSQAQHTPILELCDFLKLHLCPLPKKHTESSCHWRRNKMAAITKYINVGEEEQYKPVCDLLNVISEHLFSTTLIIMVLIMHSPASAMIRVLPRTEDQHIVR